MRVTDRMLFDLASRDGGAARARLEAAVAKASSGQRLVHPGDDPAAAGLVTRHQATAARADALATAAKAASDELASADTALNDLTNVLERAREMAVQFTSGGYTAAQRSAAATEAQSLLDRAVVALNTKVGSRWVFGGTLDGAPPFDSAGNYLGNSVSRTLEIAPGVREATSVRADLAVKGNGGGIDFFATMRTLISALQSNNAAGIGTTISSFATLTDQVATQRTQAGNGMTIFDAAAEANRAARDDATRLAAGLVDADAIDANTELALAQRGLEASLTATSAGFKLSLLDYLK